MTKLRRILSQQALAATMVGAALVAGLGWICFYYPVGSAVARLSYDLPFGLRSNIRTDEVRLVTIDEKSAIRLNQPVDAPWDRRLHAQLVDQLTKAGARAILFDLVFDLPSANPEVDDTFAKSLQDSGRVYLGAALSSSPGRMADEEKLLPPIPLLRHAAKAWGLLVFRPIDPDQGVRRIFTGNDSVSSVTWKMARDLGASLPETPPADPELWINYFIAAGDMSSVGYDVALRPDDLPADYFRDKIVVVGGSHQAVGNLEQEKDVFRTPLTRLGQPFVDGMEIHANILLNLLHHDWLERAGPRTEGGLIIAYGFLVTIVLYVLCAQGLFRAIAFAVMGALVIIAAALVSAWFYHVWWDWLVPAALQTPLALFWAVGANYILEGRQRARIRQAFSLYMSPHMAKAIAESRFDLKPGGELREVTMMFTDLEGFTALSDRIENPMELSDIMNAYFNATTNHVLDNQGMIIKYIGDAVFAAWGAPLDDDDHAYHATMAAWGMHLHSDLMVHGHRLVTRTSVNTGTVVAGNLGSDFRFDYTLIGSAVNMASRLEGLNKYLGTQVLVADSTWGKLHGRFVGRNLGRFILAGKIEPVTIHELVGPVVSTIVKGENDIFDTALASFQDGDMETAEMLWKRLLSERNGNDGPARFYLRHIARFKHDKLPSDWSGVVVMDGK